MQEGAGVRVAGVRVRVVMAARAAASWFRETLEEMMAAEKMATEVAGAEGASREVAMEMAKQEVSMGVWARWRRA